MTEPKTHDVLLHPCAEGTATGSPPTPGSWEAVEGDTNSGRLRGAWGSIQSEDWHLADVYADVDELRPCAEANARLMAAAPDLLAACKKMLSALEAVKGEPVDSDYWSINEQAEIAIAKAEGR